MIWHFFQLLFFPHFRTRIDYFCKFKYFKSRQQPCLLYTIVRIPSMLFKVAMCTFDMQLWAFLINFTTFFQRNFYSLIIDIASQYQSCCSESLYVQVGFVLIAVFQLTKFVIQSKSVLELKLVAYQARGSKLVLKLFMIHG